MASCDAVAARRTVACRARRGAQVLGPQVEVVGRECDAIATQKRGSGERPPVVDAQLVTGNTHIHLARLARDPSANSSGVCGGSGRQAMIGSKQRSISGCSTRCDRGGAHRRPRVTTAAANGGGAGVRMRGATPRLGRFAAAAAPRSAAPQRQAHHGMPHLRDQAAPHSLRPSDPEGVAPRAGDRRPGHCEDKAADGGARGRAVAGAGRGTLVGPLGVGTWERTPGRRAGGPQALSLSFWPRSYAMPLNAAQPPRRPPPPPPRAPPPSPAPPPTRHARAHTPTRQAAAPRRGRARRAAALVWGRLDPRLRPRRGPAGAPGRAAGQAAVGQRPRRGERRAQLCPAHNPLPSLAA